MIGEIFNLWEALAIAIGGAMHGHLPYFFFSFGAPFYGQANKCNIIGCE
jgi:hypothetical protein